MTIADDNRGLIAHDNTDDTMAYRTPNDRMTVIKRHIVFFLEVCEFYHVMVISYVIVSWSLAMASCHGH